MPLPPASKAWFDRRITASRPQLDGKVGDRDDFVGKERKGKRVLIEPRAKLNR